MNELTPMCVTPQGILHFFFSDPGVRTSSAAIFLDRDGVINQRIHGGYVTQWKEFHWMAGIASSLAELSALGLPIIVVSNQAGVGKGLISLDSLTEITNRFVSGLRELGARIDAVYYCPHLAEDNCSCRKPQAGLLLQAAQDWRVDLNRSVLVGDSTSDLQAARAVHCRSILLTHPNDPGGSNAASEKPNRIVQNVDTMVGCVRQLLQESS